jgi:cytochrome c peroxidase
MVALGRELFFDPVLSRGERRACASCHQPERGFTDGLPRSLPPAPGIVRRNAPTVVNAAFQGATFHDLRTTFLEDQVADVVGNADEMHRSLAEATAAVHARAEYWDAFRATFGDARDDRERQTQLRQALAAHLRSLQALDSRFDRYVRGDRSALTAPERDGFNVFMGKGKCGTCHFAPLFNGGVPPLYAKTKSEVLGVPARPVTARAVVDPDLGRFLVTRLPIHRHAFKTPTLRNVALTAPYMHNGVYHTLEEVVDFYDRGGGAGIGIALPNQTLPADSLRLTEEEKRAPVAFMQALTDTTSVRGRGRMVVGGASGVR